MEFITYEQDGFVGVVTINRPQALNALNSQVLEEIEATFDAIDLDNTRAVVLTGAGEKSFVAGADIGEMSTLTKAEGEAFGKKGNDIFRGFHFIHFADIDITKSISEFSFKTIFHTETSDKSSRYYKMISDVSDFIL